MADVTVSYQAPPRALRPAPARRRPAAALAAVALALGVAAAALPVAGATPAGPAITLRRAVQGGWTALARAWAVAALPAGYARMTEGRVTVYYPGGSGEGAAAGAAGAAAEARLTARLAARHLPAVARDLGVAAPPPATIVLVPTREALAAAIGPRWGAGAVGAYWRGVIWVLSPSCWLDTAAPGWERRFETEGPVAHELAHLLLDARSAGNRPAGWDEGVAQYEERRRTGFEWVEAANRLDQPLYALDELLNGFERLGNEALAYREAYLFVRYLAETRGDGTLTAVNDALARGLPPAAALAAATGEDPGRLEAGWRRWLGPRIDAERQDSIPVGRSKARGEGSDG